MSIYDVTISVAAGTYTNSANTLKQCLGAGHVYIVGDESTPSNVELANTGVLNNHFSITNVATTYHIRGFKLSNSSDALLGLFVSGASYLFFRNLDFGSFTTSSTHIDAQFGGVIEAEGDWTVSGGAQTHMRALSTGVLRLNGRTITLSGTPAFSATLGFCRVERAGVAVVHSMTFTGSATGRRHNVNMNGAVYVAAASATYLPGNSAGVVTSGGQYGA